MSFCAAWDRDGSHNPFGSPFFWTSLRAKSRKDKIEKIFKLNGRKEEF